jgi:hypothetical protein
MNSDPVSLWCPRCGWWFEDLEAAAAENGGWCPRCERSTADAWNVLLAGPMPVDDHRPNE